jgi:hypothetical protein
MVMAQDVQHVLFTVYLPLSAPLTSDSDSNRHSVAKSHTTRVSFNGRTLASQAKDVGSIPITRSNQGRVARSVV